MYVTQCDICKKETERHFRAKGLKIRKRINGLWSGPFWKDYHLCVDCQDNILEAVMLLKNKEHKIINGWRPISEYNRSKYDWVLVKMYDGNFECVPLVAERRGGKWYDRNDNELIFEVQEFFDFSELPHNKEFVKKETTR